MCSTFIASQKKISLCHMKQGIIMAFDYGAKLTGIATTDPTQTIASPLETVATEKLFSFLENYCQAHEVAVFVVGDPKQKDGTPSPVAAAITVFVKTLKKQFPDADIYQQDERFTSKMAFQSLIEGGVKKKKRGEKQLLDKISASIILQSFLESKIKIPV